MTEAPQRIRYVVLLVEDKLRTLEGLSEHLGDLFPHALILTASTVVEACKRIDESEASGVNISVGLLDCLLPEEKGRDPVFNTTVCQRLRPPRGNVPVIHFTGYAEDELIRRHIATAHSNAETLGSTQTRLVQKTAGSAWIKELCDMLRVHHAEVISRQTMDEFNRVYPSAGQHDLRRTWACTPRGDAGGGCGTFARINLERSIKQNWACLNEDAKKLIKDKYAVVDLDGDHLVLSLYSPESCTDEPKN